MFAYIYQQFVPFFLFIDNIVAYVRKDGIPEKLTWCIRILTLFHYFSCSFDAFCQILTENIQKISMICDANT